MMQNHMNAFAALPYGERWTTAANGTRIIAPATSIEARPVKPENNIPANASIAGIGMKIGIAVIANAHLGIALLRVFQIPDSSASIGPVNLSVHLGKQPV